MAKQKHKSRIILGETYTDLKTGFTGYAESVSFFANGCERVVLTKLSNDGEKLVRLSFDAVELDGVSDEVTYKTEIVIGEKYRDSRLDIEGYVECVTFYQNSTERASIQRMSALNRDLLDTTHDATILIRVKDDKPVKTSRPGGPDRPRAGRIGA